jgi:LPXTG-motif cell wall-anchored protein
MNPLASEFDIVIPAAPDRLWMYLAGAVAIFALAALLLWHLRRRRKSGR